MLYFSQVCLISDFRPKLCFTLYYLINVTAAQEDHPQRQNCTETRNMNLNNVYNHFNCKPLTWKRRVWNPGVRGSGLGGGRKGWFLKVAVVFLYLRLRSINEHNTHAHTHTHTSQHWTYRCTRPFQKRNMNVVVIWKYLVVDDNRRSMCWGTLVVRKAISQLLCCETQ